MKYYLSFLLLFVFVTATSAQPGMIPPMHPGMMPNMHPVVNHGPYKDSVEFKKAFEELYPLIRPTPNVRESAEAMLSHMGPMLRTRGIDSAKAYDTAMKALDPNLDRTILFNAYRAEFSAEEMKSLVAFFKTPVGQHYLEVEGQIVMARTREIQEGVAQTVYRALEPMMRAAAPKPDHSAPSQHPHPPVPPPPSQK